MQLGRFDEARIALRPCSGNAGSFSVEAGVHEFELLERRAYRSPVGAEGLSGTPAKTSRSVAPPAGAGTDAGSAGLSRAAPSRSAMPPPRWNCTAAWPNSAARRVRAEYAEAAALVLGLGDHAVAASLFFPCQEASSLPSGVAVFPRVWLR